MKKVNRDPYEKFKVFLFENKVKYEDIAELLGIGVSTVSLKINGQSDFYLSEAKAIVDYFGKSYDIF